MEGPGVSVAIPGRNCSAEQGQAGDVKNSTFGHQSLKRVGGGGGLQARVLSTLTCYRQALTKGEAVSQPPGAPDRPAQ